MLNREGRVGAGKSKADLYLRLIDVRQIGFSEADNLLLAGSGADTLEKEPPCLNRRKAAAQPGSVEPTFQL